MRKTFLTLFLVIIFASFLTADVHIQQTVHTDAFEMMGQKQPEQNELQHIWLGKNKMAMHGEKQSFILDKSKNEALMVNHTNKSYVVMELPLDITKYMPAQFMQMMGGMSITVNPTGETSTVGKWKCQGYDMQMNMMMFKTNTKVWASTNVPFDWKDYVETMFTEFTKATMMISDEAVKEIQKIEGFWVKMETSMSMMGAEMRSYQEVTDISKENAPDGTYTYPVGYDRKDAFTMEDMQKR